MRTCLFCSATPVTREHILPDWMATALGVTRLDVDSAGPDRQSWVSIGSFGLTSRYFCGPLCNYGWMRDLEEDVRPFLARLIQGKRSAISREQQRILARWLWKTTLTASTAGEPMFEKPDFEHFYRHRKPPPRTLMWVGGFRTKTTAARMSGWTMKMDLGGTPAGAQRCFTLSVGGVAMQVRSMAISDRIRFSEGDRGLRWAPQVSQFWPEDRVPVTPPEIAIGPEDFDDFASRWKPDPDPWK